LTRLDQGCELLAASPHQSTRVPADIVPELQDAYDRPEFHRATYAVFHTGPSATGDIEGVLIKGAQGVRSLTVAFIQRPG
jgi:L-lactate dehydrogenase complex protein LldG